MNVRLIRALEDARIALDLLDGMQVEQVRGPGQLSEDLIEEDLDIIWDHIEALKRA